jgi:hypothetical protein
MMRVLPLFLAAAALFGQTAAAPENAPAEVDAALRARAMEFYQLEIDGKFGQALRLVAEDTKDLFVGSSKPAYQSFQIQKIRYSDNFSKAEVLGLVTRLLPIEGFMGHPLPTKMTSRWKLENNQWCFYVDPQKDLPATPFGRPMPPGMMPPGMPAPTLGPSAATVSQPPMPKNLANPRSLLANKTEVQLASPGPSTVQVAISNPSPWPVGLTVADPKVAGLTVKLDRLTIKPGEKALLGITSSADMQIPKMPITVLIKVPQANQTIPIKVSFAN